MHSIRVENLGKNFGQTQALDGVNFEISAGQRLVAIGGSGAGKTTLLRILAGLEVADSGSVMIGDRDMTDVAAHQRGIAFLSQDYAVYPQLTVAANLQAALNPLKLPRNDAANRIDEALDWFRLNDLCNRRPAQLSGGQLQRVALAKAIVRRPRVLILDEPFSQLDPVLRETSRQLIQATTSKFNMTLVMVTHDPLDALRLADRILVLENGRLAQFGDPGTIYHSPNSLHVAELLSPLGVNVLRWTPNRFLFRPESATIVDVVDHDDRGVSPSSVSPSSVSPSSAIQYRGVLKQVQLLGFGQLAFIDVSVEVDVTSSELSSQVVKIFASASAKLPAVGSTLSFTIDKPLQNLPTE